ncbi:MAG: right-handed parallel beta-helix repeat-containing protein [Bacteroidales bacterium]|nr:right-handed parallel beta-helix repeat-containing protein [Bacteroidales bacterium]
MKYLHNFLMALSIVALAAVACRKEQNEVESGDNASRQPQDEEIILPGGFVQFNVKAETEKSTRTAVNDAGEVVWNASDEVNFLYAGGSYQSSTSTGGATATFGAVVPETGDVYAVYPSSIGALSDGSINVTIPSIQDGTFANGNFSAAQVNRSSHSASFQNISAFLKFTVSNASVKRIVVESADNSGASLTGEVAVTFDNYAISVGEVQNGGGRITLDVPSTGTYYVAVAPGVTHGGLSITYYTKDGDIYTALTPYYYNKSITFTRNHINDFGDLYPNPGHLYVSVDGSGTQSGFTAANAMSFEKWKTRVVRTSTDASNANIAQRKALNGVTFHFAAGTYSFPDTAPLVVGGYTGASSAFNFTIAGENGTIFSGEVSGAATGSMFDMRTGILNIENVIFEYAAATANTTNGAIYVNNESATVNLSHCTFRNNGNSSYIGGGIDMKKGSVNASDCTFSGNGGRQGSCLEMNSSDANAQFTRCVFESNTKQCMRIKNGTASFTDCTFSGNHESGQRGAAASLQLESAQTVTFTRCTFSGNYTEATGEDNAGGAISCEGSGIYDFTECIFSGNHTKTGTGWTSDYGGAVTVRGNAIARFNQCRFEGNYATSGGAIELKSATATTYLNACIFSRNYITYRYGTTIVAMTNAGVMCLNNCTFADDTYGPNVSSGKQLCWINLQMGSGESLVMSNCTLVGNLHKSATLNDWSDAGAGLLRFDGGAGTATLINNIIAPTVKGKDTKAIIGEGSTTLTISAISNKQYAYTHSGTYTPSGENATDYKGTSGYFGSLSYTGGTSWNDSYWGWNGTLSTGSNTNKATLVSVQTAINTANADFYAWLTAIGATDKDGRGKTRGSDTWPGAYDGTNN